MQPPKSASFALTIAGSDSCGGAGVQADLKTFAAFGVYGASVITALTAQNTLGVAAVRAVSKTMIARQLECVLQDLPLGAIKTGMLGSAAAVRLITTSLAGHHRRVPLVMDPVMVATSGAALADGATIAAMKDLMAMATLVTPNLDEARVLTGVEINDENGMREAALMLLESGCRAVLVKGGHLGKNTVTDLLLGDGIDRAWTRPLRPGQFHGTGCTLASAIAAGLALRMELGASVNRAIGYVQLAMRQSRRPARGKLRLLDHAVSPGSG